MSNRDVDLAFALECWPEVRAILTVQEGRKDWYAPDEISAMSGLIDAMDIIADREPAPPKSAVQHSDLGGAA